MSTNGKFIKQLGKHINKLRQERNLSFQKMANVCDMDKAQIYNICTKGVDLRATSLAKIAKGLGLPLADILAFK
jgi:transcriptional regulator with XRE-family HTH domain